MIMEGKIPCNFKDLNLHVTFNCGQCYRWNVQSDGSWIGVFHHCVWIIKQDERHLYYKVYGNYQKQLEKEERSNMVERYIKAQEFNRIHTSNDELYTNSMIWNYFRMYENLDEHYERWCESDINFKEKAEQFYGLRMLEQDAPEILFTFICSSNTTITRISTMVEKLCSLFGEAIGDINGKTYYDFPVLSKLVDPNVIYELKKEKFGYRAPYVVESASKILEMGDQDWFKKLKSLSYEEAKLEMMALPGIGEKVADCICLMGLGHLNAIPVDTHVFQISKRYIPELEEIKKVNKKVYKKIGDHFRHLFGHHAGWAHVVLFAADLRIHKPKHLSKICKPSRKTNNAHSRNMASKNLFNLLSSNTTLLSINKLKTL